MMINVINANSLNIVQNECQKQGKEVWPSPTNEACKQYSEEDQDFRGQRLW